jgi:hypothetical protein
LQEKKDGRTVTLPCSYSPARESWKNGFSVLLLASCKRERWKNGYIALLLASCRRERWKNGYIFLLLASCKRERDGRTVGG